MKNKISKLVRKIDEYLETKQLDLSKCLPLINMMQDMIDKSVSTRLSWVREDNHVIKKEQQRLNLAIDELQNTLDFVQDPEVQSKKLPDPKLQDCVRKIDLVTHLIGKWQNQVAVNIKNYDTLDVRDHF